MGVVLPSENGAGGTGSKEVGEPAAGDHSNLTAGTSCSHLVVLPYIQLEQMLHFCDQKFNLLDFGCLSI